MGTVYRNKDTGMIVGSNPRFADYPHLEPVREIETVQELEAALQDPPEAEAEQPQPQKPARRSRAAKG